MVQKSCGWSARRATHRGVREGLQLWAHQTQSLFLCYYLVIIAWFSTETTANFVLPYPVDNQRHIRPGISEHFISFTHYCKREQVEGTEKTGGHKESSARPATDGIVQWRASHKDSSARDVCSPGEGLFSEDTLLPFHEQIDESMLWWLPHSNRVQVSRPTLWSRAPSVFWWGATPLKADHSDPQQKMLPVCSCLEAESVEPRRLVAL